MTKRKLTLEMVEKYLGQEGKQGKGYVKFPYPICRAEGYEKMAIILHFIKTRVVIWCVIGKKIAKIVTTVKKYIKKL